MGLIEDSLRAYVGLFSVGKSDSRPLRTTVRMASSGGLWGCVLWPYRQTLRQRLDDKALPLLELSDALPIRLLKRSKAPITPLSMDHVAPGRDVFCVDNSDTEKEGVSRTYAGCDRYAPVAAYLGNEKECSSTDYFLLGFSYPAHRPPLERLFPVLLPCPLIIRSGPLFHQQR